MGVRVLVLAMAAACGSAPSGSGGGAASGGPPTVNVSVSPSGPQTGEPLVAVAEVSEPDGDAVQLVWSWDVDGLPIAASGPDAGPGLRGEQWSVTVRAFDRDGEATATATTTIGNAAPVITDAEILPKSPTSADILELVAVAEDAELDPVSLEVSWWVAEASRGLGPTLEGALRGEAVEAMVVATDGRMPSEPVWVGPVIVGNGAPQVTTVVVEPRPLTVSSGAVCEVEASDPDGDPVELSISWSVDGEPAGEGPVLSREDLFVGASVVCEARPWDGSTEGIAVESEPVVVRGRTPEPPHLRVHPVSPWEGEGLWCWEDAPAWDADGDPLVYTVTWFVDDAEWEGPVESHLFTGDTIPPGHALIGEEWRCVVEVSDGDSTSVAEASATIGEPPGGNVLVILADDLGVDKVGAYAAHPEPPRTPVIDGLAAQGVLFRSAYASPSCSPTRASLLTGRYPRRTGVGEVIHTRDDLFELPLSEVLVPEMLRHSALEYTSVALGKWHLAGNDSASSLRHPLEQGFARHAGSFGNPGSASQPPEEELGYFYWEKVVDGVPGFTRTYMTTDTIDDAIAELDGLPEPWFLYVALNAPHDPFHLPPEHLHTLELDEDALPPLRYAAMVEAMDTELGRMLEAVEPGVLSRTTLVFAGDNGTHERVIRDPWDRTRSKTTLYEGGVNVPLIVTGPLVTSPGTEVEALVHVADIFATVAEIAGVRVHPPGLVEPTHDVEALDIDGLSLLPYLASPSHPSLRRYAWSEKFAENGQTPYRTDGRTLRDERYKLISYQGGTDQLFELSAGAWDEGPPIAAPSAEQLDARARLLRAVEAHLERLEP